MSADDLRRRLPSIVIVAVLVLAAGWVGLRVVDAAWREPRAALDADIARAKSRLDAYRSSLDRAPALDRALGALTDRTLGADAETVDHRVRSRLNRLAEACRLPGASVGTGGTSVVLSPARTAFPRSTAWRRLRNEPDFVELEAWISAEGALVSILELLARIDAEPWLKRVDQVRIDPRANGDRFAISIRLTTLFRPGHVPAEIPAADGDGVAPPDDPWLTGNPFRLPAPPTPAPPPTAAAPSPPVPAPPGFPWDDWVLTGVAGGRAGPEAWLRNHRTGEARVLLLGDRIDVAELVAASSRWAEFAAGEERFRVEVGKNLRDRAPAGE